MNKVELIKLLATQTYLLHQASLNNTPNCQRLYRRMHDDIQPGQLVLETSHRVTTADYKFEPSSIGYLYQITDGKIRGPVWHIERLTDGKIKTWENATFVRVLQSV